MSSQLTIRIARALCACALVGSILTGRQSAAGPSELVAKELVRLSPPLRVGKVVFEPSHDVLRVEAANGVYSRLFQLPFAGGSSQGVAHPDVEVLRDSDGRPLAFLRRAEGSSGYQLLDRVEGIDLPLGGVRGGFDLSDDGDVLHFERDRHVHGGGLVRLSRGGERFRARRVPGLINATLSEDGDDLFVQSDGLLQIYDANTFPTGAAPRLALPVEGDFGLFDGDECLVLVHLDEALLFTVANASDQPDAIVPTDGFSMGVRTGGTIVGVLDRNSLHVLRRTGLGVYEPLVDHPLGWGEGWEARSLDAVETSEGALFAVGLRNVRERRTREAAGRAELGAIVYRIDDSGKPSELGQVRGLETKAWAFDAPRPMLPPGGRQLVLRSGDAVWGVDLP